MGQSCQWLAWGQVLRVLFVRPVLRKKHLQPEVLQKARIVSGPTTQVMHADVQCYLRPVSMGTLLGRLCALSDERFPVHSLQCTCGASFYPRNTCFIFSHNLFPTLSTEGRDGLSLSGLGEMWVGTTPIVINEIYS